jgi:universal stress protein E
MVASFFPDDAMEEAAEEVRAELNRFIAEHFDDAQKIKAYVETGSPHKAIINYATKHGTDLIIIPARAMNISKALLGSVSMHVVERAPCSVMVVRP